MLSCDNAQVVPLGLTELAPLLMGTPAAEVWRAVGQLVITMMILFVQEMLKEQLPNMNAFLEWLMIMLATRIQIYSLR